MKHDLNLAINVNGLTKSFGDNVAVDHVSLQVKKGEVFGFLGPNGSGKTTIMRMLCGLMTPNDGQGSCLGYDILTQQENIKRHVGYMPQHFSYYAELTVEDNLRFIGSLHGVSDIKATVQAVCERFGLVSRKDQYAGSLSGGWKQRMSLAAAVLNKPRLLLLDEPTASVDPNARRYFWSEIHQIANTGVTVLVSTHFMDEAIRCDRLAYVLYGKKIAEGSEAEMIAAANLAVYEVDYEPLKELYELMMREFPGATVALQSGRLRVMLKAGDEDLLKWLKKSKYGFEQVSPSIEEVFIHYSS